MSESLVPRNPYPRVSEPPLPHFPEGYCPCRFGSARIGDRELPFFLSPVYASRVHMAVLGESGSGKSKFLELYVRYLQLLKEGGMLIDPARDLCDSIASFVAYRRAIGDEEMVKRIHFLEVRPDRAFRLNVFAALPHRSAVSRVVYENALEVKGDRLVRQILRRVPAEAFEIMNRLRPRLKAVVMACGADLDGRGTRLGLGRALALCNPLHRDFERSLNLAFPHLPELQQATFRELLGDARERRGALDRWESSQNALAKLLGGFSDLVLDSSGPSLDVKGAIDRGEFIVVGLSQSPHMSYDRAVTLAGLVMDALLEAKEAEENLPPHLRKRATLIVDEVGDLLGEDLCWALRNDRKFELRMVLGAQNVAAMTRGELNLAEYVLSQCQTIVAFSQKQRTDKEIIEDRVWGGSYGFTPQMTEVQRQRGYIPVQTVDHGSSVGRSRNRSAGGSEGLTQSSMKSLALSLGWTRNWSDGTSTSTTHIHTDARGESDSSGASLTATFSPLIVGTRVVGFTPVRGEGENRARGDQRSHAEGVAEMEGKNHSEGGAEQDSLSVVRGHALALSAQSNWSAGEGENESHSETVKTTLLANLVSEWEWTGRYEEGTVADQKERNMVFLHALRQGECVISVYGHPYAIPMQVAFVDPLWNTAEEAWYAGEYVKRVIAAQWSYTFAPAGPTLPPVPPAPPVDEDDDAFVDTPIEVEALPTPAPKNPFGH